MTLASPQRSASDALSTALLQVVPKGVGVGVTDPRETYAAPFPEEAAAVARASAGRVREFAAGRAAIRLAMSELGCPAVAVPNGEDRAPRWPVGLTGSLSHCDRACIALVASSRSMRALGIDVEPNEALEPDLWPTICSVTERAWLSAQPAAERGRLARLIFSAKECIYKLQYQVSRTLIGFEALEVTPDLDIGQFEATLTEDVPGFGAGTCFHGRFAATSDVIVTTGALPQGPRWGVSGQA